MLHLSEAAFFLLSLLEYWQCSAFSVFSSTFIRVVYSCCKLSFQSMGDSASEDLSSYQPAAFKSRFLKTDRSEALKTESGAAAPVSLSSASLALGLRSVRSTFSPLAKLPENVEVKAEENDRLSKNIKDFISRTDHVANEWKNLGQHRRSGSVERGSFFDKSSVSETRDNASWSGIKPRASSVAPMTRTTAISNNPFENQFPSQLPRLSKDSAYGSGYYKDNDFTDFSLSVRGVTHSVTSRARNGITAAPLPTGGPYGPQRFMSLEEECNWILSGREPIQADNTNGYFDDEDDEDNTLDDISGDEVRLTK